ncbi:glycosyltransferase family 4 protein [Lutibacter sp.]|uniref:MraY family glycosyltransferase n=1 Tax=Lutibacter sp. TaxID=1925666 RepID=UPI00356531EC
MEYVISAIVLVLSAIVYIKVAQKYDIVDNPNFRSSHTTPTIRGGGILFFIAMAAFFIGSKFQYPYFFIGVSSIALVSFIDDIITLSAKIRLPFQFFAVALVMYQAIGFNEPLLLIGVLLVIGVGFINIYNFMDGINGITGLYSIAVLGSFVALNYKEPIVNNQLLIYTLLSLLVFGYYNFRKKARVFAGDIGSISIAVLILFLGLTFMVQLQSPVILLLVAVYGVDAGLTIVYRLYLKEHIMQPHRHHIYQKLVDVWKWPHLKVSGVYAIVQVLINSVVILSINCTVIAQIVVLIGVLAVLLIGYVFVFRQTEIKLKKVNF